MIERREERRDTNWIAMIRLADGTEIPCNVKDVSRSGARLGVPSHLPLPERFLFKVVGRDFVCSVKLAWRRGEYVGVSIEKVGKLASPQPVQEAAEAERPQGDAAHLQARRSRYASY